MSSATITQDGDKKMTGLSEYETAMRIHDLTLELQRQDRTGRYLVWADAVEAAKKMWKTMNCEHCGGTATESYECICIEDDGDARCAEDRELFI